MNFIRTIENKSYSAGFLVGAAKIAMAIVSHSWLLFIHAIYNIVKASAKHYAMRKGTGNCVTMFYSGLLVIGASAVYLFYSVYIYFFGSTASYHMNIAIGIAAVTTYEIIITLCGLNKARKKNDTYEEMLRYINLASALISVSLTQTAILSFTNDGDMSRVYAIGDAFFGVLALLVGLFMLLRSNGLEQIK